jgi:iron complex outermembrane receptor protein
LGLGSDAFNCCFVRRIATVGFVPAFVGRPNFIPPPNPDDQAAWAQFLFEGAARFGLNDTYVDQLAGLQNGNIRPFGTCIDTPDTDPNNNQICPTDPAFLGGHSFDHPVRSIPAPQIGAYAGDFLDWRVGFDFDLSEDNLLYGTVSTGHKSGGFNDSLPNVGALTFDPEEVIAYELGSRNAFDFGDGAILNGSLFYYDYSDQVFQTLVPIGPPPSPTEPPPVALLNVNVAQSSVLGAELEGSVELPAGFLVSGNLLWLDAQIDDGVVVDFRRQDFGNAANTPNADLAGNKLPLSSEWTLVGRVQQSIPFASGLFDWQALATYRSEYYTSIFNQQPLAQTPITGDPELDAVAAGFTDIQEGYWNVNLGAGWEPDDANWRIEAYVTNVLDETATQKTLLAPNLNLRFLNAPRTGGVRLRVDF